MSTARVVLRCDGGPRTGWGHAVRCLALAEALRDEHLECVFVVRELAPELTRHFERADQRVVVAGDQRGEIDACVHELSVAPRAALVLDHYDLDAEFLERVWSASRALRIVIDDLADRRMACEMIVNANPGAERLDYRAWNGSTVLRGPRFALLRRQFRGVARQPTEAEPLVLVTLGGSALAERAFEIAAAIGALDRPLRVAVLSPTDVGFHSRRLSESRVELHVAPDSVADVFARATLAISAGGTTCFELAACGVPALLVIAAENQRGTASAWSEAGVFDTLGELELLTPSTIAARVATALASPAWLAARSAAGRNAVDGLGAARVAAEIARLLR